VQLLRVLAEGPELERKDWVSDSVFSHLESTQKCFCYDVSKHFKGLKSRGFNKSYFPWLSKTEMLNVSQKCFLGHSQKRVAFLNEKLTFLNTL